MGWRYRKSFRLTPGVRINLGKSGITSVSVGERGATVNLGTRGVTGTVSLPGTGLSYRHRFGGPANQSVAQATGGTPAPPPGTPVAAGSAPVIIGAVVAVVLVGGLISMLTPASVPSQMASGPASPTTQPTPSAIIDLKPDLLTPAVARPANAATREVTAIQANVRSEPAMSGAILRTLPKGALVQVWQSENGWFRIGDRDGVTSGWVHGSVLRPPK